MKYALHWVASKWYKIAGYAVVSAAILALLVFRLDSLVPGWSRPERAAVSNSSSVQKIIDNPLYAPHKAVQFGVQKVLKPSILNMRAVSAVFGLLAVVLLYLFLRMWRTERVAVMGVALFAASNWFLHLARLATPYITTTVMLLALILCMYACVYWQSRPKTLLFLSAGVIALSLYEPGLIWVVIAFMLWQHHNVRLLLKRARIPSVVAAIALILLASLPLMYAFVKNTDLALHWLLLPDTVPPILETLKNVVRQPLALFWHAKTDPVWNTGDLPLLDAFSFTMLVLGLYHWRRSVTKRRLPFAIGLLLAGIVLLALNQPEAYKMLLAPPVYLSIAAGVTILLQQWFTVFPRNPLARNIGIGLLAAVIGVTSLYHMTRYFVAWPNAPETKAAFSLKAPQQ